MSRQQDRPKEQAKESNYSLIGPSMGSLLAACLLLNSPQAAHAQISGINNEDFQRIEQTLGLRLGVSATGLGLIGFELWWFLFSKGKKPSDQLATGQLATDIVVPQPDITITAPDTTTAEPTREAPDRATSDQEVTLDSTSDTVAMPSDAPQHPWLQHNYKTLVDISIAYGGMQMSHCLMMVQDQMCPKFSMSM
ncbi:MAG: hypothetical protein AAF716_12130 [Cyanobacteria bacterium P01_D01_bin.1]